MARVPDELLPHESDGIQEYDNPLPRWWLLLFLGCVAWALVYVPYYHVFTDWSSAKRYDNEVAAAAESGGGAQVVAPIDFSNLQAVMADPARVEAGAVVYTTFCASCHKADGSGLIGPSFLDAEWLHGYEPAQIMKTISDGVPEKGMVAWGSTLGPDKVASVAAYVTSLGGVAKARELGLPSGSGGHEAGETEHDEHEEHEGEEGHGD